LDPKVTVLMSVYNGETYLCEAIDSILNQTLTNFEFLIIDDASTDRTLKILQSYEDPRIQLIRNCENLGLTKSLNKGIKLAKGEYIARMDADDISYPQRLEKQLFFLERNPDIGVLGTWTLNIDETGKSVGSEKFPVYPETIKISIIFGYSLAHPSVMMRKNILNLVGGYDENIRYAQDYDLWIRCLKITKISNYPDILLKYRIHLTKISKTNRRFQLETGLDKLTKYLIENFNLTIEKKMLIFLLQSDNLESLSEFQNITKTLNLILCDFLQETPLHLLSKLELILCVHQKKFSFKFNAKNESGKKGLLYPIIQFEQFLGNVGIYFIKETIIFLPKQVYFKFLYLKTSWARSMN